MKSSRGFSTGKTLAAILMYFLLFLAGDLLSSLPFDLLFSVVKLPSSALYVSCRMLGSLALTLLLFWLYTTKRLGLRMADFGICGKPDRRSVLLSVLLPAFVTLVFAAVGQVEVHAFSAGEIALIVLASLLIALKSGITEEILFRGFIMRLLESRWGKPVAILLPSILFGLVHIPSMESFTVSGVLLLVVSGTLVGVMFSLAAYRSGSIAESALLHAVWNLVMITDLLHITTAQGAYGSSLVSIIIPADSILLTGAGFGVEASLAAIIGYALVCLALLKP